MGKKCDLCSGVARMYCESDEASLCWDCDGKVHGANFLVAKHTRCLLCTACQSLTPWKATGLRLLPTFSVCDSCVALKHSAARRNRVSSENPDQEEVNSFDSQEDRLRDDGAESYDDDDDEDADDDDDDDDDDEGDVDDDEETDNQVVPWSAAAQPPPVMSSSSSDGGFVMKRTRENSDLLCSDDEIGSSSAQGSNYSPPLKRSSRDEPPFKSTAVVNSVVRLSTADTSASSSSLIFAIDNTRRDLSR